MNIQGFDLNLLKVLNAMFDEQRTTRVANRLHMSQPSVSHALNKLRDALHDQLFVREGNRMLPTPFAETLREPVKRVLRIVASEIAGDHNFVPADTHRCFTFSTSDIGELVFLPKIVDALAKQAPNATIRCLSMPPRDLEAAMANGSVDIALGYFPDLTGGGFYQQRLFDHRFTCLVRIGHPTIGDEITLDEFLAADHAVVMHEGRSQEIFERRMQQLGLERRILLRSPHFMSVPLLVATTDMITTVPRAVGTIYRKLAPIRLVEPPIEIPPFELKQLWHRRVHADPAIVWLRDLVSRLFLNRDPSREE
jgi:DNA-binding transcriptional LysR family regulator